MVVHGNGQLVDVGADGQHVHRHDGALLRSGPDPIGAHQPLTDLDETIVRVRFRSGGRPMGRSPRLRTQSDRSTQNWSRLVRWPLSTPLTFNATWAISAAMGACSRTIARPNQKAARPRIRLHRPSMRGCFTANKRGGDDRTQRRLDDRSPGQLLSHCNNCECPHLPTCWFGRWPMRCVAEHPPPNVVPERRHHEAGDDVATSGDDTLRADEESDRCKRPIRDRPRQASTADPAACGLLRYDDHRDQQKSKGVIHSCRGPWGRDEADLAWMLRTRQTFLATLCLIPRTLRLP